MAVFQLRSWVWKYAERRGNKAHCLVCDDGLYNVFSANGGSTGAIGNHLKLVHKIYPPSSNTAREISHMRTSYGSRDGCKSTTGSEGMDWNDPTFEAKFNISDASVESSNGEHEPTAGDSLGTSERPTSFAPLPVQTDAMQLTRVYTRGNIGCSPERSERIHQALAKMIATLQLFPSFVSSEAFIEFMATVEPNYKVCPEQALNKRLATFVDVVRNKIRTELSAAPVVACTADCWVSLETQSYLTLQVHLLDQTWTPKTFTLTTQPIGEHQTAAELAEAIDSMLKEWDIQQKTVAVVTDNVDRLVDAVHGMRNLSITAGLACATQTLQLVAGKALAHPPVTALCQKAAELVEHFRHSREAARALQDEQQRLAMPKQQLKQSIRNRWNSTIEMAECLIANRVAIFNVLVNRSLTTESLANKLEITDSEWTQIEELVTVFKPFQMAITIFCSDAFSPTSMVRPVVQQIIKNHLKLASHDFEFARELKEILRNELKQRFDLHTETRQRTTARVRPVSSFLDPRYKNLDGELEETKNWVRSYVRNLMATQDTHVSVASNSTHEMASSAFAYLYQQTVTSHGDIDAQLEGYLSEPQLRFDLNPWDWWKVSDQRYPAVAAVARRYLCIPASSPSSQRIFSSAENITTLTRTSLRPVDIAVLVFLFENRHML